MEKKRVGRTFNTGAYRDNNEDKIDPEGFYNPLVVLAFCKYMQKHRLQSNGELRESDNWQKGIPKKSYAESLWRHFLDWWLEHRGYESRDGIIEALCGLIFNAQGYLFEIIKEEMKDPKNKDLPFEEILGLKMIIDPTLPKGTVTLKKP